MFSKPEVGFEMNDVRIDGRIYKVLDLSVGSIGGPVRKVVKRSNARVTHEYPGRKYALPGELVPCDSLLEVQSRELADCDPQITRYHAQPSVIKVTYRSDSEVKSLKHVPDFLDFLGERKEFVEIKYKKEAEEPEIAVRTALLTSALPTYGYTYRLMTECDIQMPPARLANAQYLLRHSRGTVIEVVDYERVRLAFTHRTPITFADIKAELLGSHGHGLVCQMIIEGTLAIERGAPITDRTRIEWATAASQPPPPD